MAPTFTPIPVPPRITCPTCEGSGEIVTGQSRDGYIYDEPCRTCGLQGTVPNPDFDPTMPLWSCGCTGPLAGVLAAGEGCRACGVEIPEPQQPMELAA
jgi:hypothetical protein